MAYLFHLDCTQLLYKENKLFKILVTNIKALDNFNNTIFTTLLK